ncbi:hypothetical protein [Tepidiforma thermophila]|uniref:Uncharacterized protein n=1 Tax=Tepidiforma thermophila (strain KCTC 52669 / CGMCC 1.13589 / G233) TaxID=2761530 RepID=A0A2A9HIX6_TEPT2|nr:hypothetical protein [Tepidiforma thermophila]PFG75080.1 hypothetical protein A9A59_2345 [Tepidiforma thermophila]
MFQYPFEPRGHGLAATHDGRLFATGLPEPAWLRRRFEQAEALKGGGSAADQGAPAQATAGRWARLRSVFGVR